MLDESKIELVQFFVSLPEEFKPIKKGLPRKMSIGTAIIVCELLNGLSEEVVFTFDYKGRK